ncbi:chemotaxis protein CheA [Teredinibacter turnerae]|uniref:chemotaxis protein CheA n=1 Tax=Teredinibacter turnerae TaxID=2426 RepID=UPI00035DE51D|nr:chemotaxis protein CheA [Teredinibacter turnerae]
MFGVITTFQNEAREHLQLFEEALLELEDNPHNASCIDQAFRSIHTIKGAGGIVGYRELCNFAHHVENVMDKIRSGKYDISSELISFFLDAKDHIQAMLPNPEPESHLIIEGQQLLDKLYKVLPDEADQHSVSTPFESTAIEQEEKPATKVFRIRFTPDADSFKNGFDVRPLLRELGGLGHCQVTTITHNLPDFNALQPQLSAMRWDLTLLTEQPQSSVDDVFIFVIDDWTLEIEEIDLTDKDAISDKLGELLIARGIISQNQLSDALAEHREVGKILQDQGLVKDDDIKAALAEQQVTRETKKQTGNDNSGETTVRVPADRLDKLMNLVGELVIVQARLNQEATKREDEGVLAISEDLDRLTTELRDNTFSLRMLPIGSTFGRYRRLVRDVSRDLNKKIVLHTEGAETELDKMMIDKLADPLVHLIRNSIDHGIEPPADREAAGKNATGTILLRAQHSDSQVKIEVHDDGRGLDTDIIFSKAVEKGLVAADAQLDNESIFKLIFEPGFSTAKTVSEISGRGVGMDVVKRSIQDLGGKLAVQSELGEGTHFRISLPLTTAIIEGLMVQVSNERYVLPLSVVEECVEIKSSATKTNDRRRLAKVRDQRIPYMRLREWFRLSGIIPDIEQIVIVRLGEERFGFCVDEVIGQYQTVIKRLGKMYENTVGYSGATILGDGSVAIILDPLSLRDAIQHEVEILDKAG